MQYTWLDAFLGLLVGAAGVLCLWLVREREAEWWPGKGWMIMGCVVLIIITEYLIY